MATTVETAYLERHAPIEAPRAKPVKGWALAGAFFIAIELYVYIRWLAIGPNHVSPGPTKYVRPHFAWVGNAFVGVVALAAIIYFVFYRPYKRDGHISKDRFLVILPLVSFVFHLWDFGVISYGVVVYFVVYRGWKYERRIGFDTLFVLAFPLLAWQDHLLNFTRTVAVYNVHGGHNIGSWVESVPGWASPRGGYMAAPHNVWFGIYGTYMFGMAMGVSVLMGAAKRRWPRLGTFGLLLGTVIVLIVWGIAYELEVMYFSQAYAYPGAIRWLSLFPGKAYQYPIYEGILQALFLTGWGAIRYFKTAQGESPAERGVHEVHTSDKKKLGLRYLAIVGVTNVIFLGFNIAWQPFALHAGPWPKDILNKSYMLDQLCGPGTGYACGGQEIPLPVGKSGHVDPSGRYIPAHSNTRSGTRAP
jgi:hypothetical protein